MIRFILPSLFFLVLSTCVRAQTLPITYEKQLIGYSFNYDNLRMQMPNFRRAMANDPEARAVMYGAGATEVAGVFLVSYGTITVVTSALLLGYEEDTLEDGDRRWMIGAGLAGVALGGWLVHLADKKRIRAVDVYNKNLKQPASTRAVLRVGSGGRGVGVGLRF